MGILEWFGARPTEASFAKRFLAAVSAREPGEWTWDREAGALRRGSGGVINLGNIYLEYAGAARGVRRALLDKYVQMALMAERELPALWVVAAKNVFTVLRSRFDLDLGGIGLRGQDVRPMSVVRRPFLDDLELRLVYDHGASLGTFGASQLETWGQTEDAVFEQGLRNLAALQAPTWSDVGDGVFALESEVSYTESFLLVPKVVDRLPFAAHAVLSPCHRGILLAADGRSASALLAMLNMAIGALSSQPWPMSHTLCERDGAGWRRLVRDGAVGEKLREFQRMSEHVTYRDQKTELDRLHERTGTDVYVATASLMRRSPDGPVESWCTWSQGVDTLLPVCDRVALLRVEDEPEGKPVMVPWSAMWPVCGALLAATSESPVRYRATRFPDAAQWAALKAVGEAAG